MGANKITYKIKTATEKEICSHLKKCDNNFLPPLSERVNINDYAKKIFEKSVTFEAWADHKLAGLIATYFKNDEYSAFITNVSVINSFMNLGIGSELLNMCIAYARQNNFKEIKLDVHKNNDQVIGFYKKHDFIQVDARNDSLIMKLEITG